MMTYVGIDLHATNSVVVVIDDVDRCCIRSGCAMSCP